MILLQLIYEKAIFKILDSARFQTLVCAKITCAIYVKHSGTWVPRASILSQNVGGGAHSSFFFFVNKTHNSDAAQSLRIIIHIG